MTWGSPSPNDHIDHNLKHLIFNKSPFAFFSTSYFVSGFLLLSTMGLSHFHLFSGSLLFGPIICLTLVLNFVQQCWGSSSSIHSTNSIKSWHVSRMSLLWNTKQHVQGCKPFKNAIFFMKFSLMGIKVNFALNSYTYFRNTPNIFPY